MNEELLHRNIGYYSIPWQSNLTKNSKTAMLVVPNIWSSSYQWLPVVKNKGIHQNLHGNKKCWELILTANRNAEIAVHLYLKYNHTFKGNKNKQYRQEFTKPTFLLETSTLTNLVLLMLYWVMVLHNLAIKWIFVVYSAEFVRRGI
jgi:hypothetical protein